MINFKKIIMGAVAALAITTGSSEAASVKNIVDINNTLKLTTWSDPLWIANNADELSVPGGVVKFELNTNKDTVFDVAVTMYTSSTTVEEFFNKFNTENFVYSVEVNGSPNYFRFTNNGNTVTFEPALNKWKYFITETDISLSVINTKSNGYYSHQWTWLESYGDGSVVEEPFDPVAPVPLPGAVWMFLAGLGALFAARKTQ